MRRDFLRFSINDSLGSALSEMAKHRVSSAFVFEDGGLAGIVSAKSVAKGLSSRGFFPPLKKEKATLLSRMENSNIGKFTRHAGASLNADQDVSAVLGTLASNESCIPVFDGKRVVGMVRNEDITNFLLSEFAKGAHKAELKPDDDVMVDTAIDSVLAIVRRIKAVPVRDVAKELGISQKSVEKLGATLSRHHIIRMDYSFLKGATLRLIEHDKK